MPASAQRLEQADQGLRMGEAHLDQHVLRLEQGRLRREHGEQINRAGLILGFGNVVGTLRGGTDIRLRIELLLGPLHRGQASSTSLSAETIDLR